MILLTRVIRIYESWSWQEIFQFFFSQLASNRGPWMRMKIFAAVERGYRKKRKICRTCWLLTAPTHELFQRENAWEWFTRWCGHAILEFVYERYRWNCLWALATGYCSPGSVFRTEFLAKIRWEFTNVYLFHKFSCYMSPLLRCAPTFALHILTEDGRLSMKFEAI